MKKWSGLVGLSVFLFPGQCCVDNGVGVREGFSEKKIRNDGKTN